MVTLRIISCILKTEKGIQIMHIILPGNLWLLNHLHVYEATQITSKKQIKPSNIFFRIFHCFTFSSSLASDAPDNIIIVFFPPSWFIIIHSVSTRHANTQLPRDLLKLCITLQSIVRILIDNRHILPSKLTANNILLFY